MNPKFMIVVAMLALTTTHFSAADDITYNADVRPILADKCFACHGPDDETREADLRLDLREEAVDAGAIAPSDPDASALVERIFSSDTESVMPPTSANKPLSETEKETLRRWIADGANYQRHWAFEPIGDVPVPAVSDADWCRTPIDHFILNRLDEKQLSPSDEADRYTLIRRVYLDLIGLLPTPEQVDAFVNDESDDAYSRLVDSLLESKHYGERWGRHWLDQARYADSNGYTFDNPRTMWPYRDWVIQAINDDMPFDQFTIEQLAGDLLPEPTKDQLIATGFHRNTLINEEGGTDDEQFRVESVIDRTNTTGTVWLALTVGCAQCHHHKFDPIRQEDYYGLYAFFNSTEDKNNRGPEVVVDDPHTERIRVINTELADLKRKAKASRKLAEQESPLEWQLLHPVQYAADSGANFQLLDDNSLLVSGADAVEETYHVHFDIAPQSIAAIRLETLEHDSLPNQGPGRAGNGNFVLADVSLHDADGNEIPLNNFATAEHSQSGHHVSRAVDDDPRTGWAINGAQGNIARWAHFTLKDSLTTDQPSRLTLKLAFWQGQRPYNLGRFRVLVSSSVPPGEDLHQAKIEALEKEKKSLEGKRVKAMVMRELATPRPTHVLIRGDFLRPGDEVNPALPAQLHESGAVDASLTRLDLAQWIVDPKNPITPRVAVNRVWHQYFGKGIVETVEDFGSQGTPPTHPQLLDWLAKEFVANGWSMKQLHRLIVSSAVYRQSSAARSELAVADPLNTLLGRQNRLRVDAEIVRDLALSASGKLTERIGGPSVFPPQPDGVYAFTQKKKNWTTSTGEDRYRRTMYTFFYRSSPHPMLTVFDTPRFNVSCTRRTRSNTPLQSLMVANDPGMYELAERIAERVLQEKSTSADRLERAFRLCLCRPPRPDEMKFLGEFLQTQEQSFRSTSDRTDDGTKLAWIAVTRVLMNLDEFITRE